MITLKELNSFKRGDDWYEVSIQLISDDPPFEAVLPTITHYIDREKDMEANIDKEVKEILEKHEVKKPDRSVSLATCEKKANELAVSIMKAVE